MFMLSWIRSSDASANGTAASAAASGTHDNTDQHQQQDDWVVLPSDHNDLMTASVSNLDLLSSSMTLYHPSSSSSPSSRHTHPAAGRSRNTTHDGLAGSSSTMLPLMNHKSRRQLKQEQRRQQELEAMERRPRYDPMMAKLRDAEFKMMKLNKMGLRTGRILSSTTGGASSLKGQQRSSASSAVSSGASPLKIC